MLDLSSMGARTSNPKRSDDCLSLNCAYPTWNSPEFHASKRRRFSSISQNLERRVVPSNSTVARLSRYPQEITQLPREVHAPSRTLRFGSPKSLKKDEFGDIMGNLLSNNYNKAKRCALGSLRFLGKDKDRIEWGPENEKNEVAEDSSIEEVEVIEEYGRERRSRDGGIVVNALEPDVKILEVRNQPSSSSDLSNENENVDNAEKMFDALSLDVYDVSAYKKLFEKSQRRDPELKSLNFQIQLNEKRRSIIKSLRPVVVEKPVEEVVPEPFVPLTNEEVIEVERAFSSHRRKVLVSHKDIDITGEILQCLRPGAWLNDDVINLYLELLKERENREQQKYLKCHFFNTFFYKKLIRGGVYDYTNVRRWTTQRKLGYGLIECDKIFVPIHKDIHWCLAVINCKDEKFQYLDSLGGQDYQVLNILARYYGDEVKDKCGKDVDLSSWQQEFVEDLPEQQNSFDCAVFMIKYIDFYSRGLGLNFNQGHMPYFRLRTAKEILRVRAD